MPTRGCKIKKKKGHENQKQLRRNLSPRNIKKETIKNNFSFLKLNDHSKN